MTAKFTHQHLQLINKMGKSEMMAFLALMARWPATKLSISELTKITTMDRRQLTRALARLEKRGLLRRELCPGQHSIYHLLTDLELAP